MGISRGIFFAPVILLIILAAAPVKATPHSSYANFAQPLQSYSLNTRDFAFTDGVQTKTLSISASDYAVYRYAYVSLDGNAWISVPLSGNTLGGLWLNGSVTGQLSFTAINFSLSSPGSLSKRNFLVVYTCSRSGDSWDCHDGWQIMQFNASLVEQGCIPSCTGRQCGNDGCEGSCGDCTDGTECVDGTCVETGQRDTYDITGKIMDAVGLVHDQEFVIPENSIAGDTAGQLNRMWLDYFDQSVTYSIVGGNDNGAFSIDSSGVISVANAAGLDYGTKPVYGLTVRATEAGTGETDEAVISIKLTDCSPGKTFFVNPRCNSEEGCCGQGTRACPYARWYDALGSWGQTPIAPGTAYLQKRGSVASEWLHTISSGTPAAHIIFGAYGSGARPVLDGSYTTDQNVRGIYPGSFSSPVMYMDYYSFEVRDFPSTGVTIPPNSHHVAITDLYVHDNGDRPDVTYDAGHKSPGIYLWENTTSRLIPVNDVVRDTVMINNHEHGVKTEGSGITIDFSYAEGNGGNGFSCPAAGNVNFTNSIAIGNDASGFKLQCNDMHVENDVSERNYQDGYMNANYYATGEYKIGDGRFGFNVSAVNVIAAHNIGEGFIFGDNVEGSTVDGLLSYNNSHGIWARHESHNNTIKNSRIYNNFLSGIFFSNYMSSQGSRDTHDYTVQNNLIYDNGFVDDRYAAIASGEVRYKGYEAGGNSWCTIYPSGDYAHTGGYYFYDEPSGIDIEDASDIRIIGNRIYNSVGQNFVPVRTTSQSSGIVQSGNVFE